MSIDFSKPLQTKSGLPVEIPDKKIIQIFWNKNPDCFWAKVFNDYKHLNKCEYVPHNSVLIKTIEVEV